MVENRSDQYEELLEDVLTNGSYKSDRTGTGTLSVFGRQIRFNLAESFPLVTTKRVHFKSIVIELLWFLRGDSNARWLQERGVSIWNEWAQSDGELGPIYGVQWRSWPAPDGRKIDQIQNLLQELRSSPDSRRHIVSAWNVSELDRMALMPCHVLFQFHVLDGKLSCQLYQRSADMFLGVPFNIASYSLLTLMVAHQLGLKPGEFIWTGGDCHIYLDHIKAAREQLTRTPFHYPTIHFSREPQSIFDYKVEDIELMDYRHHPRITAPVAV